MRSYRSFTFCKRKTRGETQFWIELAASCTLANHNEINSDDTLPLFIYLTPVSCDGSNHLWRQRLLLSPCSLWHCYTRVTPWFLLGGGREGVRLRMWKHLNQIKWFKFRTVLWIQYSGVIGIFTKWSCQADVHVHIVHELWFLYYAPFRRRRGISVGRYVSMQPIMREQLIPWTYTWYTD